MTTRTIELTLRDADHGKRLKDPITNSISHLEAWLPFSEAAKLDPGNANVRPPSERRKPFKDMRMTVDTEPNIFHLKNRGIIYRCDAFDLNVNRRTLSISTPLMQIDEADATPEEQETIPRYGVADGGHTFRVITDTVSRLNELREKDGWSEPFVRVHFLAGETTGTLEELVEALNTSTQVQQYSLEEYRNEFEGLKDALRQGGFDLSLVAFTENEDDREWNVREVIQRMSCFLKDRWMNVQPTNMYKSRGKALDLYANPTTRVEFEKLYPVIADVITLPEFIESEFSIGEASKNKRFGKLKSVRSLKKPYTRPGTAFTTEHQMDLAASLPLAAAFRELLEEKNGVYHWRLDPRVVFRSVATDLYDLLLLRSKQVKNVNTLGSDTEYWTQAVNIVLRAKDKVQIAA